MNAVRKFAANLRHPVRGTWLWLDWISHRLPQWVGFGRARYYICDKADAEIWRTVGPEPRT